GRVGSGHAIKLTGNKAGQRERERQAYDQPENYQSHSLSNYQSEHVTRLSSERLANADFAGPIAHQKSHHAINSRYSHGQRQQTQRDRKNRSDPRGLQFTRDDLFKPCDPDRNVFVERTNHFFRRDGKPLLIGVHPEHEADSRLFLSKRGSIKEGAVQSLEVQASGVPGYTYDLRNIIEPFTDGILPGPETVGHGLADDDIRSFSLDFLLGEMTAPDDRDSQSMKV